MAAFPSPYGAQIIGDMSGTPRTLRVPLGIASGYAANIFKYQPVKMVVPGGGLPATLQAVTNPGGTPDSIYGIFAGVEFTPLGGRPAVLPFWPAGTVWDPGYDMFAYIWEAWLPGTRIAVQADGPVTQALLGSGFNFSNLGAGNTSVGLSNCTVAAAGVPAGSQAQLTLVEFGSYPNDPGASQPGPYGGDAFTDLICTVAYPQIGFRGQNSIG